MRRVFDVLYYQQDQMPLGSCLNNKKGGSWQSFSTDEVIRLSASVAKGLMNIGLKKGDKVAIVSTNRPEWNFIDLACQQIGIVTVPMYPTITVDDYHYIFEHAEVKVVFAENEDLIDKSLEAIEGIGVEHVYSFEKLESVKYWEEILSNDVSIDELKELSDRVDPEDLLTIIYTSGTTGRPKGVMLSHSNVVSNFLSMSELIGGVFKEEPRVLSFLPLCHILERTAVYFYMLHGCSVYYAESIEKIGENILEVKPNMFCTVPRLLEKVYDKILAKGNELSFLKKRLFLWSINLGLKFDPEASHGLLYRVSLSIVNRLVFSKWREALGGNIFYILSGAAALQPRLAKVFWAAGIPIYEAYGLTETSPGIASNSPEGIRIGSVGRAISGVEVKIAADGEVLCKGPNVMKGYYKNPELTDQVIREGWFHTGDIGKVEDGYLTITDRKKEMFKTSGGKYIAPQWIENLLKESRFIEQVMVVGEGKRFPAALIVPNFDALSDWCKVNGCKYSGYDALVQDSKVLDLFKAEIEMSNAVLGQWEQIKKFMLVIEPWRVDTGELTPTMKLKRRVIKIKFKQLILSMYS